MVEIKRATPTRRTGLFCDGVEYIPEMAWRDAVEFGWFEYGEADMLMDIHLQVTETPQRLSPRATRYSTGRSGSVWSNAARITN